MIFRSRLRYLVIISLCIRIFVAYVTELNNDEAYYYTYALHLQWNYFDHPPGVAILIKFTTLNLLFTNEVFVRLGAIICAAAGTWLSYKTGNYIRNERTGFYAAVLYNTSIYSSIIAGTFILPDSPQIVFWLAALFVMIKIINHQNSTRVPLKYWLLFGLFTGICILCKVHGIFLWIGLGLYILIYKRKLFLESGFYLSFIITLILVSPIFFWNLYNHFITYTYHSGRITVHAFSLHITSFLQAVFGQILYNNPINVFLIAAAIFSGRNKRILQNNVQNILVLTGLPIIVIVSAISLFNNILPHWSGPGFVTLTFIAAAYLDKTVASDFIKLPQILRNSLLLALCVVIIALALILFYPGTIGSKNKPRYGSGDFTLDVSGWKKFGVHYKDWMQQQPDRNTLQHLKIVCNKWFPAAHIAYYLASPAQTQIIGVGNLKDLHNFAWLNHSETDLKKGENALCIVPSNYNEDVKTVYGNTFTSIIKLHIFFEERNGKLTRYFTLFLLENYTGNDEVHNMKISF